MDGLCFYLLVQPIVSCCVVHSKKSYTLMTATGVMMLRVWAMYSRSGLILGIILTFFFVEIVSSILVVAMNSNPKNVLCM